MFCFPSSLIRFLRFWLHCFLLECSLFIILLVLSNILLSLSPLLYSVNLIFFFFRHFITLMFYIPPFRFLLYLWHIYFRYFLFGFLLHLKTFRVSSLRLKFTFYCKLLINRIPLISSRRNLLFYKYIYGSTLLTTPFGLVVLTHISKHKLSYCEANMNTQLTTISFVHMDKCTDKIICST